MKYLWEVVNAQRTRDEQRLKLDEKRGKITITGSI